MHRNETPVTRALREARNRKNWNQVQTAVHAGVSLSNYSLAERTGFLTQRTAERLAAALGVPVELLRGEG